MNTELSPNTTPENFQEMENLLIQFCTGVRGYNAHGACVLLQTLGPETGFLCLYRAYSIYVCFDPDRRERLCGWAPPQAGVLKSSMVGRQEFVIQCVREFYKMLLKMTNEAIGVRDASDVTYFAAVVWNGIESLAEDCLAVIQEFDTIESDEE